jgi:hypothetical protein
MVYLSLKIQIFSTSPGRNGTVCFLLGKHSVELMHYVAPSPTYCFSVQINVIAEGPIQICEQVLKKRLVLGSCLLVYLYLSSTSLPSMTQYVISDLRFDGSAYWTAADAS